MTKYKPKIETTEGIKKFQGLHPDILVSPIGEGFGCGAYSQTLLVQNGGIAGKVVKGLTYCDNSIEDLFSLEKKYISFLGRIGINMPATELVVEQNLFYLVQEFVPFQTAVSVLSSRNNDASQDAFRRIAEKTLDAYQKMPCVEGENILGLDSRLENWCIGDDLIFIDLFPPLLNDKQGTFRRFFYSTDFEQEFTRRPKKSFLRNRIKALTRLYLEANAVTEGLDETLRMIVGDYLNTQEMRSFERLIKNERAHKEIIIPPGYKNGGT